MQVSHKQPTHIGSPSPTGNELRTTPSWREPRRSQTTSPRKPKGIQRIREERMKSLPLHSDYVAMTRQSGFNNHKRIANLDRKGGAANIVATEVYLAGMPTGEHKLKVTAGLRTELKLSSPLSIVESAHAHLSAFFGLKQLDGADIGDCIDLSGDGPATEEGGNSPAESATSSVEVLNHLIQLTAADDDSQDLFARLDAIRGGLVRLKKEVSHVDRMLQLGTNMHAALGIAANNLKITSEKDIPKLLQDYKAPKENPEIAAVAQAIERAQRECFDAGMAADEHRTRLQNTLRPSITQLQTLLLREAKSQIGSSVDRCFELARVQVTANEMFKDAFDIITSEILAEQPDEYQEFVQLTREVRYTCLREGRDINQTSEDLLTLYCHGLRLAEPFTKLLSAITKEASGQASMSVAPMKGLYRCIEKSLLRPSNFLPDWRNRYANSSTRDFRRGFVQGSSMSELIRILKALLARERAGQIVIVRIKDRFWRRRADGWADAVINFYFADDPSKHICELQLVYEDLMTARAGLGARHAYCKGRAAGELLRLSQVAGGVSRDLPAMFSLWTEWHAMFDEWDVSVGWLEQADPSEWYGVKHVDEAGNVLELDLRYNGIVGPMFPHSLALFQKLRRLDLSGNCFRMGFSGALFEHMTSLTSLKLSYCEPQLSGPIPSEILELRNLEALGTRQLVGLICSFNTPSDPTFFDLSSNKLEQLPKDFGSLIRLKTLNLGDNPITALPESFRRLVALRYLDLSCMQLRLPGLPSVLFHLTNLTDLEMGDAYVDESLRTEPISERIAALKTLKSLSLFNCGFSGPLPALFWSLTALEHLDLSSNQFSGEISALVGKLRRLESLELQVNRFSGPIPAEICDLEGCEILDLSEQGEWKTVSENGPDGKRISLKRLVPDTGGLTGKIPADIGRCRSLVSISLQCNLLSNCVPVSLTELTNLESLDLRDNERLVPPPECPVNAKGIILHYEDESTILKFFECIRSAAETSALEGGKDPRMAKLQKLAHSGNTKAKDILERLQSLTNVELTPQTP